MSEKVGIFGGTFSPIHYGHINSITNVIKKLGLDSVRVIPAYQSPGKDFIETPNPNERLKIVELGLADYKEHVSIDACELNRAGVSYSVDTLKELIEKEPNKEFYLIIGLDQFSNFDKWKDFYQILEMANLVVTSRPGYSFPHKPEDFPEGLKEKIKDFDGYLALLENGKNINFVRLNDHDISSSDIRKKVRLQQSINKYVPIEVENYILENSFYSPEKSVDYKPEELMMSIKSCLEELGGMSPIAFDLREENQITDFNVITSSQSKRGNMKMAENLIEKIKSSLAVKPLAVDGKEEANWVVIDYGSVIVHLFYDTVRHEYNLEKLWNTYPKI